MLVEDLAGRVAGLEEPPWRLAVTTFFHIHEVQELMEPRGIETVALSAEATLRSGRLQTPLDHVQQAVPDVLRLCPDEAAQGTVDQEHC